MISYSLFIIDDEPAVRESIVLAFGETYAVTGFADAESALAAMPDQPPDLVLLDIGLPGMNGIEALRRIKAQHPDVLVVIVTAFEDLQTVIAAMKLGAQDYVTKPLHLDTLEVTVANALEKIRLRKEVRSLQETYLQENLPVFITESNALQDVIAFVNRVARSPDTPVLILGETGTGKELIAQAIHYRSPNFAHALITVNCAAMPRELIESELFGYEKGAFSGASPTGKKGLIEEAENGTLFLDEIGDLSLESQAKLLRFLENGQFYRLGGTRLIRVKTRLVSATNQDLEKMMAEGRFRKDLFYRLGVIQVRVPSLNDRRDGILPLAKHFLDAFSRKFKRSLTGLTAEAQEAILNHRWTGNVRELKNRMERAALTARGPAITPADLGLGPEGGVGAPGNWAENSAPQVAPLPPEGIDLAAVLSACEGHYIREALRMAEGNESRAAKLLRMNHHTFRYRRKKLGIA
ncbi:MAG: sigma-54 dependent transcriptional regulator [Desulfobacteraceae bacterium]|jgi:DNA-binding NtrC family response regulator